jgi:hypothetical protein
MARRAARPQQVMSVNGVDMSNGSISGEFRSVLKPDLTELVLVLRNNPALCAVYEFDPTTTRTGSVYKSKRTVSSQRQPRPMTIAVAEEAETPVPRARSATSNTSPTLPSPTAVRQPVAFLGKGVLDAQATPVDVKELFRRVDVPRDGGDGTSWPKDVRAANHSTALLLSCYFWKHVLACMRSLGSAKRWFLCLLFHLMIHLFLERARVSRTRYLHTCWRTLSGSAGC